MYGLLGLFKDLDEKELEVDYNLSVRGVYTIAAKALIFSYGTLSWLCQAVLEDVNDQNELPTSLPDWSSEEYVSDITEFTMKSHSACGNLPPMATFMSGDLELRVTGFEFDEILKICSTYFTRCPKSFTHSHYEGKIVDILRRTVQWTQTACENLLNLESEATVSKWSEEFRNWITSLAGPDWTALENAQRPMLSRTLTANLDSRPESDMYEAFCWEVAHLQAHGSDESCHQCAVRVDEATSVGRRFEYAVLAARRRLFITAKANMGLAQHSGLEGDQV